MAKKLPKKPKAPKITASLETWLKYDKKVAEHKRKVASHHSGHKRKAALIRKHKGI